MAEVGSAFLTILPSAKGFRGQLESQTGPGAASAGKTAGSKFSSGMASSLKAVGIAAAGAAAISFIKGSIAEAREAQKVGAQTAQVIKTTGGAAGVSAKQISALATSISKKSGIDDEAIQSGENLLLTFTNVQDKAGAGNQIFSRATQTITDMSAALGQDTKSSAIQLGKALNDPVKGITALSRVGVSFTQGQKDQIKTMVKAGDTLGAQKIILGELSKEFGGSAAAQATAGDKMKVAWGNLQETIGQKLAPALDKLEAGLSKVFGFVAAHQGVMIAIGSVIGVILVGALVAATVAVWNFTVALLANPLVWIVIAIIALVVGIVLLIKHWDLVKAKTIAVWNAIKSFLTGVWNGIKTAVASTWDSIKTAISTKAGQVLDFVKTWGKKFLDIYLFLPKQMLKIGTDIVLGLRDGLSAAWHFVTDKVHELVAKIPLAIRKLLGIASPSKVMMELGGHIASGLALGIESGQSNVQASLRGLTTGLSTSARLDASVIGGGSSSAPDRPIYTDTGALIGVLRESMDHRARLVLREEAFAAGMTA